MCREGLAFCRKGRVCLWSQGKRAACVSTRKVAVEEEKWEEEKWCLKEGFGLVDSMRLETSLWRTRGHSLLPLLVNGMVWARGL
jgi:hypothetical protein